MSRSFWVRALGLSAAVSAVALALSCSSATDSTPSGDATLIDQASVSRGITEMNAFLPVCRPASGSIAQPLAVRLDGPASVLTRVLAMRRDPAARAAFSVISAALGPNKPADQLGDCGGRITYPTYSHSNGITSGTYAFQNYCSIDDDTGMRTTQDGTISFVVTGTPSGSGPITNKIEATSSGGIAMSVRDASGAQISSQRFTFTDYVYTAGVPGGTPTASNPNRFTAAEMKIIDEVTGKTYRQTKYTASLFGTPSGGEQATVSGRGYRSNGEYFDLATTAPVVTDASGDITGGQLTFRGANNSTAVLTLVPGSVLQGTMTVNGAPVTTVPVCR